MTAALRAILVHDLKVALRQGGGFGLALVFFAAIVAVTPFAVGPDLALLARIGGAILWLGALLATLVGLDRLFATDSEDGTLDLYRAAPVPLALVVLAKAAAHWLTTGLPLVAATPLLALTMNLTPAAMGAAMLTLLVGTPALTMLGAIGAALTVGLRRGGLLIPVLVLPLAVPVLIFGVAAAERVAEEGPGAAPLMLLAGLTLATLAAAPLAAAAALEASQE